MIPAQNERKGIPSMPHDSGVVIESITKEMKLCFSEKYFSHIPYTF
jgi:hypothetical protein